jgi:hypothetical protein
MSSAPSASMPRVVPVAGAAGSSSLTPAVEISAARHSARYGANRFRVRREQIGTVDQRAAISARGGGRASRFRDRSRRAAVAEGAKGLGRQRDVDADSRDDVAAARASAASSSRIPPRPLVDREVVRPLERDVDRAASASAARDDATRA